MSVQLTIMVAAVVIAVVATAFARLARLARHPVDGEYTYVSADALLTQGELAFLRVLRGLIPCGVCINFKVRVADIIQVAPGTSRQRWSAAFNKIQSKHVDFVLCDSDSIKILCVIELHDKSHNTQKRTVRDNFIRHALASGAVPFIEVKASRMYNASDPRDRLNDLLAQGAVLPSSAVA